MNNKIALCAIAPPPPRLLISKKMDFRKKATSVEKNTLVNREGHQHTINNVFWDIVLDL